MTSNEVGMMLRTNRREFIFASVATASGFILGLRPTNVVSDTGAASRIREQLAAYLEMREDGSIRIVTPQSEMGQGVYDSLPRVLADELDADWSRVEIVMPHANPLLANPRTARQVTADSNSVRDYFQHLRTLGAAARSMLVAAAAERWNVDAVECRTSKGWVLHPRTGRRLGYGELAKRAGELELPTEPKLKSAEELTLIGRAMPRRDALEKVTGKTVFGIDVQLPGMLTAVLRMPETFTGTVEPVDLLPALRMPGVVDAFIIDDGIAVVAKSFWEAKRAADALEVKVVPGSIQRVDDGTVRAALEEALASDMFVLANDPVSRKKPDIARVRSELASCERILEAEYESPYLAHLTMEPQCCTALVTNERCEIWAPHQNPGDARALAAQLTGLPLDKVHLNVTFIGTGLGRKWELDTVRQCVQIAKRLPGRPIKLIWTREQDLRHDFYRPASKVRVRIGLNADGWPRAMTFRLAGQSLLRAKGRAIPDLADPTMTSSLIDAHYDVPYRAVEFAEVDLPVPIGYWRSVASSHCCFYRESALDEAAALARIDPYRYRRKLLSRHPRPLAVLDAVARALVWDKPVPKNTARGIAFSSAFGTYCAHAVEVAVAGKISIRRMVCAADCGTTIDPDVVRAQLEGGTIFGLSAALKGGVTLADGGVVQSNFHDHPMLRISEVPPLEIIHIPSNAPPGGIGEVAVPSAIAALANAVSAASGIRVRGLPVIATM